eukprot:COSAG05_NODE_3623_length_1952_cov_1.683216_1_plen_566_part_00
MARHDWTMPLLLVANAVDSADLSLLPGLFRVFEQDFGIGPKELSALVVSQSVLKGLAYPVWGMLADRFDRRSALWQACVAWGIASAVVAVASQFLVMLICLAAGGVALACLMPVSQSIMSDIIPAPQRGTAFGHMALAGNIGGLLGGALSTTTSEWMVLGFRGWRFSFGLVAVLSLLLAPIVRHCVVEPTRQSEGHHGAAARALGMKQQLVLICSRRTFLLLVCQGVVGNMPWVAFDSFGVLWFQYIGFANGTVAQMMVMRRLGSGLGSAFGGWLSDKLFAVMGDGARVLCAQISVLSGFPTIYTVLVLIPRETDSYYAFMAAVFAFGFGASWCTPACNRPIITEIVVPEVRGSILGFWLGIETVLSAFSAPAAALLATDVFSYTPSDKPIAKMSAADRAVNVEALAQALLWTMVLPWIPCLLCYTLMHLTYKKDKAEYQAELAMGGFALEEKSDGGTCTAQNEEEEEEEGESQDGEHERVGLLARSQAGAGVAVGAALAAHHSAIPRTATNTREPSESEVAARLLSDSEAGPTQAAADAASVVVTGAAISTSGASFRGRGQPRP